MTIDVGNHKALDLARSKVGFCYLCGNSFKNFNGSKPRGSKVEHLIPKGILGKGDSASKTPATLWVHSDCDALNKQSFDNSVVAFHKLHLENPDDWNPRMAMQAKSLFSKRLKHETGLDIPAIDGEQLTRLCKLWVTGFHALLYGTYLPDRKGILTTIPPFTSFSTTSVNESGVVSYDALSKGVSDQEKWWSFNNTVIELADTAGFVDKVSAWGNEVEYRAVWCELNALKRSSRDLKSICFWDLRHPGLDDVGVKINGNARRWCGKYEYFAVPSGASVLSDFLPDK